MPHPPEPNRRRPLALLALALATLSIVAPPSPAPVDTARGTEPLSYDNALRLHAASRDGLRVVFSSTRRLAAGDRDRFLDVYRREGGRTALLSGGRFGRGADGAVKFTAATPDARTVLLATEAQLTAADGDRHKDLYRRGPSGLELISIGPSPRKTVGGLGSSAVSADGSRVFFTTDERLLSRDRDDERDVYGHRDGRLRLIPIGPTGSAQLRAVSANGRRVVFSTTASVDPRDTDGFSDLYSYAAGRATLLSGAGSPSSCPEPVTRCSVIFAAASSDATRVYFTTELPLSRLDSDTRADIYRGGRGGVEMVSTGPGDSHTFETSLGPISADGRRAFFTTEEALIGDAYCAVYERRGGRTKVVSVIRGDPIYINGCEADEIAVSKDGSAVVFSEGGVHFDQSGKLYRREGGRTETIVSVPQTPGSEQVGAFLQHVSADGSRVVFLTWRSLVPGDTDGGYDIYSRGPGGFSLISIGPIGGNTPHEGDPGFISEAFPQYEGASEDGRRIFFTIRERLLRGDRNNRFDLYERGPAGLRLVSTR